MTIYSFHLERGVITMLIKREILRDFQVNIPERWSIAQLYQSALDQEAHVEKYVI